MRAGFFEAQPPRPAILRGENSEQTEIDDTMRAIVEDGKGR